jgi:hypothetical protein
VRQAAHDSPLDPGLRAGLFLSQGC